VIEVLTAFVRENSYKKLAEPEITAERNNPTALLESEEKPREDIQVIMTVIGRRFWTETERRQLNLKNVNLRGYDLFQANLRGANLIGTDLSKVNLHRADLRGADLSEANLSRANLNNADLKEAVLRGTNFEYADLKDADLKDANLVDARLSRGWNLRLEQILPAVSPEFADLPRDLLTGFKEWKTKQSEEKKGAEEDSRNDTASE
jgi:hypothetical protein